MPVVQDHFCVLELIRLVRCRFGLTARRCHTSGEYRANWQEDTAHSSPFASRFAPRSSLINAVFQLSQKSVIARLTVFLQAEIGVKLASLIRRAHDRHLSVRKGSAVYLAGLKRIEMWNFHCIGNQFMLIPRLKKINKNQRL